ncbi:MAG: protein kinase [Planctomycetes bacterium]|nr:protein kinase [Planctomycetota bacterium]
MAETGGQPVQTGQSAGGGRSAGPNTPTIDARSAPPVRSVQAATITTDHIQHIWGQSLSMDATDGMTLRSEYDGSVTIVQSGSWTHLPIKEHSFSQTGEAAAQAPSDYEILKRLGEGGMAVVYEAKQSSLDRTIALKFLKSQHAENQAQRAKLLAEAVVIGDLDHPNVVPIHELGMDAQGMLFYAMKRVQGTPWSKVLAEKSEAENIEILMDVANAVAFAHSRGVIHRDIKPENVMLGEFGEVLVMDWGLAASVRQGSKAERLEARAVGGTPAYMAPEMARGVAEELGVHSDVYLLGAILYEIAAGKRPHTGKNALDCLANAANNIIQPTDMTGELVDIALKAISTDPADRYAGVKDFQAAIRGYEAHLQSIRTAQQAREDLELACQSDSYDLFAKSVFGFQEAVRFWSENRKARMGLTEAGLRYARCALEKGDLDLAASQLQMDEPSHKQLGAKIAIARAERSARHRRLKILTYGSAGLVAATLITVTIFLLFIRSQQSRLIGEQRDRIKSQEAAMLAEESRRNLQQGIESSARWQEKVALPSRKPGEASSWEPAFQDDFTDKDLARNWSSWSGSWSAGDGELVLAAGQGGFICRRGSLEGDVRIEFEFRQTPGPPDKECSVGAFFSAIPKAPDQWHLSGYAFEHDQTRLAIRKEGKKFASQSSSPLSDGKWHRLRAERIGRNLRVFADEQAVPAEDAQPFEVAGRSAIGLYAGPAETRFRNLRIFALSVRPRTDILQIAQWNMDKGKYALACVLFQEIADSDTSFERVAAAAKGLERARRALSAEQRKRKYVQEIRKIWPDLPARLEIDSRLRLVLDLSGLTAVSDLAPIAGMELDGLILDGTGVKALNDIKGMKLAMLSCRRLPVFSLDPLKGMRLEELDCSWTNVSDLAPLAGMPLEKLDCTGTKIDSLEPLAGMPLKQLRCCRTKVASLDPLAGLAPKAVWCRDTQIASLSPFEQNPPATFIFESPRLARPYIEQVRKTWSGRTGMARHVDYIDVSLALRDNDREALKRLAALAGNKRMLLLCNDLTWQEAKDFCQNMGGRLACPQDKQQEVILKQESQYVAMPIWVGGSVKGGKAEWLSGSPVEDLLVIDQQGFLAWQADQPIVITDPDRRLPLIIEWPR